MKDDYQCDKFEYIKYGLGVNIAPPSEDELSLPMGVNGFRESCYLSPFLSSDLHVEMPCIVNCCMNTRMD